MGYDPAAKYDLIYRTMCHNINHVTLRAELDMATDESTWGFMGFMGNADGRLMNKPVGKGGQTTMVFYVTRRYPRAYVHRHKMHVRPNGFNAEGKFEVKNLIDQIYMLVDEQTPDKDLIFTESPPSLCEPPTTYTRRRIYSRPPHITCDNHFLGGQCIGLCRQ